MKIARLVLPWAKTSDFSMNARGSWGKRHRLVKAQRGMATSIAWHEGLHLCRKNIPAEGDIKVTLTCCPPTRTQYPDDDNLITAQKGALDAIAAVLQVNDQRFKIQPVRKGERSKDGGVIVEIEVSQ